MGLFNKNKAPEQAQELSPEQKVARVLEAISKYIADNQEELQNDREKAQRIRDIAAEAEELSKWNVNEEQASQLVEKARSEGIQVDLETQTEDADVSKTKKSNKKMATYILAALLGLGLIGGGAYIYSKSGDKESGKGKTEHVWGTKTPWTSADASYQDQLKKLEELGKRNQAAKDALNNK